LTSGGRSGVLLANAELDIALFLITSVTSGTISLSDVPSSPTEEWQ